MATQNVRDKMVQMVRADGGTSLYNRYKSGHLKAFNELKTALKDLIVKAQNSDNLEDQKLARGVSGYLSTLGIGRPIDPAGYHSALMAWKKATAKTAARTASYWFEWESPADVPADVVKDMKRAIREAQYDVTVPIPPWGSAKVILYNATRGGAALDIEILASREAQLKRLKFGPMRISPVSLDHDDLIKMYRARGFYDRKAALAEIFMKYWKEYIEPLYYSEAKPRELDAEGYPVYDDSERS